MIHDLISAALYEAWAALVLAATVYWGVTGAQWLARRWRA